MATIPMPSLSISGWIRDTRKIIDLALSHAFVSDASHSTTCPGTITSFQALVQKHENNPDNLAAATQTAFQEYLARYVTSIRVEVTHAPMDPENPDNGAYKLLLKLSAVENGETVDISEAITVDGSMFSRIKQFNQDGL